MKNAPESPRFEEVYPRYEFAPLVNFALAAAKWIQERRSRHTSIPTITGERCDSEAAAAPTSHFGASATPLKFAGREPSLPRGDEVTTPTQRHS